jgi:spore germination cell wall hydrolase CwlJ-like protein
MNGRRIAAALAGAILIVSVGDVAAFEQDRPVRLASVTIPMPRSRAVEPVYQLAALPSKPMSDLPIVRTGLPKARGDIDAFRLLVPPIDIRITAPPAGARAGKWGRSAPRKPDRYAAATFCMAKAIYYEARSEPAAGRLAVGRVILNRVKSRFYPGTICEVVYQNAHMRNRCQFSFACDGKPDVPRHMRAWNDAVLMAERLLCRAGKTCRPTIIGGKINISTHYHATYVKPRWSKKLPRTGRIGQHIFYFTASR